MLAEVVVMIGKDELVCSIHSLVNSVSSFMEFRCCSVHGGGCGGCLSDFVVRTRRRTALTGPERTSQVKQRQLYQDLAPAKLSSIDLLMAS